MGHGTNGRPRYGKDTGMRRASLLLVAVAVAAGAVGGTHCDTCDDFPTPCVGNCGFAPSAPPGAPGGPMPTMGFNPAGPMTPSSLGTSEPTAAPAPAPTTTPSNGGSTGPAPLPGPAPEPAPAPAPNTTSSPF